MKVKINRYYAVYSWHWDVEDDEMCGICRVPFDGTCPSCKYPGDQCPLVIGECQHAFHMHCIWKWLETETAKGLCPMCRQPFNMDNDKEVNKGIKIPANSGYLQDVDANNSNEVDLTGRGNQENEDSYSIQEQQAYQAENPTTASTNSGVHFSSESLQ